MLMPSNIPPAPPPAPLPNGKSNEYDFILNSTSSPKGGFSSKLGGSSTAQRLILVVGGAVVMLLIVIVLFSVVFKGGGGTAAQLMDLAEQQNEIARVADIGVNKATSSATKNFAHTTKLSLLSDQQQTLALLKKIGRKVNVKLLGSKNNPVTDQQLDDATANNEFDTTFTKIITDELTSYRSSVQADYKSATGTNEKQLLQDSFNSVSILINNQKST